MRLHNKGVLGTVLSVRKEAVRRVQTRSRSSEEENNKELSKQPPHEEIPPN